MKVLPTMAEVLRQVWRKPVTNLFPARYLPPSIRDLLDQVAAGKATLNPPIPTPPNYRGRITYDRESCIGCKLCTRVCPANAIEFLPETKRVRIYVTQCVFCAQCTDACPKNSLSMSDEFLLATDDRYSEVMIVE
ncbi:MAG: 4Fe-4S binding protein [Methanomicrobiales archaeon]